MYFKTKNLVLDVSSGTILDCQVLRSNLPLTMFTCWKSLFPSRFLPAPFPICNEKGLFVLKNQELNGTHKNPDLLKRIALDCLVPKSSFVNMYDWHFPCVKPGIKERVTKFTEFTFQTWLQSIDTQIRARWSGFIPESNDDLEEDTQYFIKTNVCGKKVLQLVCKSKFFKIFCGFRFLNVKISIFV